MCEALAAFPRKRGALLGGGAGAVAEILRRLQPLRIGVVGEHQPVALHRVDHFAGDAGAQRGAAPATAEPALANAWRSVASRAFPVLRQTTNLPDAARRLQRLGPPGLGGLWPQRPFHVAFRRKRHRSDLTRRLLALECRNDGVQIVTMLARNRRTISAHLVDDEISTRHGLQDRPSISSSFDLRRPYSSPNALRLACGGRSQLFRIRKVSRVAADRCSRC